MKRIYQFPWYLPGILLILVVPATARSYSFTPTESEWLAWPEYCQARYSTTLWGSRSKYGTRVSEAVQAHWESSAGEAYTHLHHYCAGLAYLNRSRVETNESEVAHLLTMAAAEMTYTLERVHPPNMLYPEIAVNLAMVHHYSGDNDTALQILDKLIADRPDSASAYTAKSIIYKEAGKKEQQEQILLEGNRAVKGTSAEIHYFLGLYYLHHKDYPNAVAHAKDAYRLGYPLPWLRQKLAQAGYEP